MSKVSAEQKNKPWKRIQFSGVLSQEDNNLIRDYRFTQIMTTQNTELTFSNVVDDIFAAYREYMLNAAILTPRESAKRRGHRIAVQIRPEDYKMLQDYRLKKILTTGDTNFSLNDAFIQIIDIFRQMLERRNYALMSRPAVVRAAESRPVK